MFNMKDLTKPVGDEGSFDFEGLKANLESMKEGYRLEAILQTIEEQMNLNLESEDVSLDTLNLLSENIKTFAEKFDIDHSLLSDSYEDKEVALKMINLEGMDLLKKIKDKIADKIGKSMTAIGDLTKRIRIATKGDGFIKKMEKAFDNSIKHTVTFTDKEIKFIERAYRSYMYVYDIGSVTALVSSFKRPTGHIDDAMKAFEETLKLDEKETSLRDIRDTIWKALDHNKADQNIVKYIYESDAFEENEKNGIKDRSIRTYLGTPYKDFVQVIMVGTVDASFIDKKLEIKRVTAKEVLRFKEPKEFKNVLDIGVAKVAIKGIQDELKKLEGDLNKLMKMSTNAVSVPVFTARKQILSDLYELIFSSIIDRYACIKDSLYVLEKAADVA